MNSEKLIERENVSVGLAGTTAKSFLLLVALAVVGVLVACTSDEDPTAVPNTPTQVPTATAAPAPTAAPADTPTAMPEPTVAKSDDTQMEDDDPSDAMVDEPVLSVVTTSNIIGDWVKNVGGDRVEVKSLIPAGGDPHMYHPTARDATDVADADLVLSVGLSLEAGWLTDFLNNVGADGSNHVALGDYVDAIEFAETGGHHGHDEHADHEDDDAHMEDEHEHGDDDEHADHADDDDAHMEDEHEHGDDDEHADHADDDDAHMEDEHEHGDDDEHADHADDDDAHMEDEHEHGDHDEDHAKLTGRLLIADGDHAELSVIDLTTGALDDHSLEVAAANPTLYSSPSERFAFVIVRGPEDGDDRVHIFDGGIYLVPHGDHLDLVTDPVRLLESGTSDERPVHVSRHNGWTAIFHDATGRIALFEEHELEHEADEYEPVWLEAGLQHGAAVPLSDGHLVVTSNNPDYPETAESSLPLGVEVWTIDGEVVYDASSRDCPGLHGEAPNHHGVMFGCVGGVLFIEAHDGHYDHDFIDNSADMHADARIGTVWAHDNVEPFYGSASYRQEDGARVNGGFWMIDAEAGEMSLVLPATDEKRVLRADFSEDGHELFVLTADGHLNIIEAGHGEVEEELELVDHETAESGVSFTIAGDFMYVSEAENGRVFEFHLKDHEIEREWSVEGHPGSVAFVGLSAGADFVVHDTDHEDEHAEDEHDEHAHAEEEDEHDEHGHHDHDHGPLDPHFWFDPIRVKGSVHEIAELLSELDPAGAEYYEANAEAYENHLDELHSWALEQVSEIPVERRVLVTSHDSMSYFAVLYGFEVVGTVIPGLSTEAESTASQLAELVEVIEEHNVPTVFGETTVTERIARTIADETGAEFVSLYSGSLGAEGSGADTYIGMFRTNVELIVNALR